MWLSFPCSLCTPAAFCATGNLRTGERVLQMDSPEATAPSWLMPCLPSPRPCCVRCLGASWRMQCPRCPSPCWEKCPCGYARAAEKAWKRRKWGAPKSRLHRWITSTNLNQNWVTDLNRYCCAKVSHFCCLILLSVNTFYLVEMLYTGINTYRYLHCQIRYYNIIAGTAHKVILTALYNYHNFIFIGFFTRKSPPPQTLR